MMGPCPPLIIEFRSFYVVAIHSISTSHFFRLSCLPFTLFVLFVVCVQMGKLYRTVSSGDYFHVVSEWERHYRC